LAFTRTGHEIYGWGYHACPVGVYRWIKRFFGNLQWDVNWFHAERCVRIGQNRMF
ncbi:uncharacterized protein METZ01_LOCUS509829, partial [marine metagenome]